jgi:hypothetical protein
MFERSRAKYRFMGRAAYLFPLVLASGLLIAWGTQIIDFTGICSA